MAKEGKGSPKEYLLIVLLELLRMMAFLQSYPNLLAVKQLGISRSVLLWISRKYGEYLQSSCDTLHDTDPGVDNDEVDTEEGSLNRTNLPSILL